MKVDASGWTTEQDLHRDIAAALDFPDYYGRNLDALNEAEWLNARRRPGTEQA